MSIHNLIHNKKFYLLLVIYSLDIRLKDIRGILNLQVHVNICGYLKKCYFTYFFKIKL